MQDKTALTAQRPGHLLGQHDAPLMQAGVIVPGFDTLCYTQQDPVQYLQHGLGWFDAVREGACICLELEHVSIWGTVDVCGALGVCGALALDVCSVLGVCGALGELFRRLLMRLVVM